MTRREDRQREVEVAEDASFDLNLGAVAVLFPMVDQSVSIVVMHPYMVQSHAAVYMMVSLSTTTIFLFQKCHLNALYASGSSAAYFHFIALVSLAYPFIRLYTLSIPVFPTRSSE